MLALLTVPGCHTEADYARVRRDCEDEVGGWRPSTSAGDVAGSIGARCAATLGESIGLDWDGFGFEPSDLSGSETGAYVLAGLLVVAASDDAALSDVLADPDLPHVAADRLERLASEADLPGTSPAAEAWFGLVHEAIRSTTFSETVLSGAAAAYSAEEQSVVFAPALLRWDRTLAGADLPAAASAQIVHEASHSFTDVHVPCATNATRDCDATVEGAYGIGIWWLHAWLRDYRDDVAADDCRDLDDLQAGACGHVEDADGWPPCAGSCP
ncbi:MAG: hypothetical protein ACOZNI_07750 [Myxococcota bacterium]